MRDKLIEFLGGVPVPDPDDLGEEREFVTQEFQLRLAQTDLLAGARSRAEIVESAMRLLSEAAAKIEADSRVVDRSRGVGPDAEEVAFAQAASRSLPRAE